MGSTSASPPPFSLDSIPLNSRVWLAVELLCILAQISAGVWVLALFPHENPPVPLRLWILGYTLGCLLLLPLLYFRYTHRALGNGEDFLLWQQQQQAEEEERRRQWRLRETPSRPAMASSRPVSPLRLPRAAPAAVSTVDLSSSDSSSVSSSSNSSPFSSLRPRSPGGLVFTAAPAAAQAAPVAAQTAPNSPYLGARVSGGRGEAAGGWANPFGDSAAGSGWTAASGVDMYSAIYYNGYDYDDDEDELYGEGRYSGFRHIAAAVGERMLSCVRWIVDELQDDARVLALVERYKVTLDCFFAVWFVLGNVWVFGANSAATTAPNLYNLSVLFITLSCVSYALPFLLCAAICCCLPCLLHLLGHPHQDDHNAFPLARSSRGATTAAITTLPSFKYRRLPYGRGGRVVRLRGKRAAAAGAAGGGGGAAAAAAASGKAAVSDGFLISKAGRQTAACMGGRPSEAGSGSLGREGGGTGAVGGGSGAEQGRGGVGGGAGGWFGRLGGYLMRRTAGAAGATGTAGTAGAGVEYPVAAAAASGGGGGGASASAGNAAAGATGGACAAGDRRKSASEESEKEREREEGSESEGDSDEEEESVVGLLWPGTDKQRPVRGGDALCCICLGRYRDGVDLRELPCSHHFHQSCVDTWLKINSSCPLCKEDIASRPRLEADAASIPVAPFV
ncbi:unnamed protein product [Closterium sp. Yama58-4]|nr:unnamed protein product [Closterium sp. Yama58-4]